MTLTAVVVVALVVIGFGAWYELQAHPGGSPGPAVVVTVDPGEGSGAVVDRMAAQGVVTSGLAFRLFLLLHGTPTVRAGSYLFHKNISFGAARQGMAGGPDVNPLEIPAGFTLSEVAQRVGYLPGHETSRFLSVAKSGVVTSPWEAQGSSNLEGLVASGTYLVLPGESDTTLLRQMVQRFGQQAAAVHVTPSVASQLGVTPNELVTVASIVQKEGVLPSNMGKVARVIYNRLSTSTPLQMDSTVLYSLGRDGGAVTSADLQLSTPYNTYLHSGLPPTPIAIPSSAALSAAGHPPAGSWRYFVVIDHQGNEAFSTTYSEQLANEALARSRGLG